MIPGTVAITSLILVADLFQRCEIVAEQFDRILALDAGHLLLDVVLEILREIELTPGNSAVKAASTCCVSLFLVDATAGQSATGFSGDEEFGIEEPGGIGAVIGPALSARRRSRLRGSCMISRRIRLT